MDCVALTMSMVYMYVGWVGLGCYPTRLLFGSRDRRCNRRRRCLLQLLQRLPFLYEDDSMRLLHGDACVLSHVHDVLFISKVERFHRVVSVRNDFGRVVVEVDAFEPRGDTLLVTRAALLCGANTRVQTSYVDSKHSFIYHVCVYANINVNTNIASRPYIGWRRFVCRSSIYSGKTGG